MTEENKSGVVETTITAVAELAKEVPIYQDAVQPVAQETGKALQTVGRAVNAALLPIKGLVWGIEQIEKFVQERLSKKLEHVPESQIVTPDPAVAGPALEALRYVGHKESLSEMYANLLAASMDSETAQSAHPGFVEVIKNLCADEAKILSHLYKNPVWPVVDIRKESRKDHSGINQRMYVTTIAHYPPASG